MKPTETEQSPHGAPAPDPGSLPTLRQAERLRASQQRSDELRHCARAIAALLDEHDATYAVQQVMQCDASGTPHYHYIVNVVSRS